MTHKHIKRKVVSIKNILSLFLSFLLILLFFILEFTPLLRSTENDITEFIDNKKSEIVLIDNVPKNTEKLFLDLNKEDFGPKDFKAINFEGKTISFYKTLFGASAQIAPSQIDTDLNLKITTYAFGEINVIMTYTDSSNVMLKQNKEVYHFERDYILIYILRFGIIFLGLILGLVTIAVIKSKRDMNMKEAKLMEVGNESNQ